AELVHAGMGAGTSGGGRSAGPVHQVRGLARHVHRLIGLQRTVVPSYDLGSKPRRAKPYSRSRVPCPRGIALMEFRNERTWQNAVELGKTEECHVNYETAVDKVRSEFGQTLPMIIDGKE